MSDRIDEIDAGELRRSFGIIIDLAVPDYAVVSKLIDPNKNGGVSILLSWTNDTSLRSINFLKELEGVENNETSDLYNDLANRQWTTVTVEELIKISRKKKCGKKKIGVQNVDHPEHYNKGDIEVWDAIKDWRLGYFLGNAVKYIARCEHKGHMEEDLRKAIAYIEKRIELGSLYR